MQIWAEFDFHILTGVFQFIKPTPANLLKKLSPTKALLKRKRKDKVEDEEDEDEEVSVYEEDEDDEDDSSTPKDFILSTKDRPSLKSPRWNFRWRGKETGEGEIQFSSKEYLCSITFHGVGGTKLTRIFESDLIRQAKFTGLKIGYSPPNRSNPSHGWESRGESAYEFARVSRWR